MRDNVERALDLMYLATEYVRHNIPTSEMTDYQLIRKVYGLVTNCLEHYEAAIEIAKCARYDTYE